MKKNLSKAMAAAMAFGAVAPMVSQTIVANADTPTSEGVHTTDVRAAEGYTLATNGKDATDGTELVFTREQAFDTHFTTDTSDDTLKIQGAKIVKTINVGEDKDVSNDLYVIAKPVTAKEQATAKAELELHVKEIRNLLAKTNSLGESIYTIEKIETNAEIEVVATFDEAQVRADAELAETNNIRTAAELAETNKIRTAAELAETNTIIADFIANNQDATEEQIAAHLAEQADVIAAAGDTAVADRAADITDAGDTAVADGAADITAAGDAAVAEAQASLVNPSTQEAVYTVILTNQEDASTVTYNFNGVAVNEDTVYENVTIDVDPEAVNVKENYLELNTLKYELEKVGSKIKAVKKELNPTTLEVKIYSKDADTTKEGTELFTITLNNFNVIDKDLVIDMPAKSDVDGHWAKEQILSAMLNGWVDASATFRPEDSITRAEFAKIVCEAYGLDDVTNKVEPFSDVVEGDWYYNYVVALYNLGAEAGIVIDGYEDGTFKPNANITRQEAAKIIATIENNYVAVDTTDIDGNHIDVKTKFEDDSKIASWADQSVVRLTNDGIINGYEVSKGKYEFRAENNITRAEALVIIERAATN